MGQRLSCKKKPVLNDNPISNILTDMDDLISNSIRTLETRLENVRKTKVESSEKNQYVEFLVEKILYLKNLRSMHEFKNMSEQVKILESEAEY